MNAAGKKVGVISFGCDKNRVDTEKMLAVLSQKHTLTADVTKAEIVIVNTCAFLAASREESLSEIRALSQLKKSGASALEKIIVTGCLPSLNAELIDTDSLQVDAVTGISGYAGINDMIDEIYRGGKVCRIGARQNEPLTARTLTTDNYAYLKIADGCSNCCTYCLIPKIRGAYRSVPEQSLLTEAENLGETDELILVAQDLTKYGSDLKNGVNICGLLKKLSALDNVKHIRLLYCYPENVTDELISEIKNNPKILHYLDVPFQHADYGILRRMNRKGARKDYLSLIEKIRKEIPDVAVRSTFITGFPGETEEQFQNLISFLEEARLLNVGFFAYSREKGTVSYAYGEQTDNKTKSRRLKKLYAVQRKISASILKGYLGVRLSVMCDGYDNGRKMFYGRSYLNAPDIDGTVYFTSKDCAEPGKRYLVTVTGADSYDLYGEKT